MSREVDTHVFRYAQQLHWAPTAAERAAQNARAESKARWPQVTRDTVYAHLNAIVPDDLKYSLHLIMTDTVSATRLSNWNRSKSKLGFFKWQVTTLRQ